MPLEPAVPDLERDADAGFPPSTSLFLEPAAAADLFFIAIASPPGPAIRQLPAFLDCRTLLPYDFGPEAEWQGTRAMRSSKA